MHPTIQKKKHLNFVFFKHTIRKILFLCIEPYQKKTIKFCVIWACVNFFFNPYLAL